MLYQSLRAAIVAVSLAALSIAPTAFASGGSGSGGGGGTPPPPAVIAPCATLSYALSTTALVYYGTSTFTTTVTNCSSDIETVLISYAVAPTKNALCVSSLGTWSDAVTLKAGEIRKLVTTKYTPYCFYTDSVDATVTAADGTILATANTAGSTSNGGHKSGGLGGA